MDEDLGAEFRLITARNDA